MNNYSLHDILFVIAVAWFVSMVNVLMFSLLIMAGKKRDGDGDE